MRRYGVSKYVTAVAFLVIGLIVGAAIAMSSPGQVVTTTVTQSRVVTVTKTITPAAPTTTPTTTQKPTGFTGTIYIGTTISLKGKFAHEGEYALNGFKVAIKWLNEVHGGIKVGDKVYKVELKYYDDESSSQRVPELYSKLITEDKVNFLLAPYSSGLTKAAAPVAEQNKIIMVSHGGASDSIFQQGYKYVVQTLSPASTYLRSVVDLIAEKDPNAKIALIYENAAFAATVAKGAKDEIQKRGLKLVYEKPYEKGATEFGSIINEAMAAGAEVLLGGGHFADGTALVQQAWQLGWKLKGIGIIVAPALAEFKEQLKEAADGVMYPAQWEIGVKYSPEAAKKLGIEWFGPTNEEYIQMYKEISGGGMPDYHAAEATAAILHLAKAIEVAGSLDSDAVRAAFNKVDIMTFFGRLKIDPATGLQVGHQMVVVQWQAGEKKIVYPPEAAQAGPIYPAENWYKR
ncbi:MAG: amino acid ABC transporter substrate-binding protein [Candidatus Korarchaeota archaeon]|nr:amino acid ABC transporter substrate-binding protein [Candidatus Korarchaeota archaeon]